MSDDSSSSEEDEFIDLLLNSAFVDDEGMRNSTTEEEKDDEEDVWPETLEKARQKVNAAGREMEDLRILLDDIKAKEVFCEGLSVMTIGMKNLEREGKHASIVKYDKGKSLVTVKYKKSDSDVELDVHENCICMIRKEDVEDDEDGTNRRRTESLEPGNVFVGSICIPGITSSTTRAPYSLSILSSHMFRHTAYGDTQFCHVRSKLSSKDVVVEYVDAETQCRITNVKSMKKNIILSGNVSQLKHPIGLEAEGEAVFRYEESKITHTLDLHLNLLSSHERYKETSLLLHEARENFLLRFDDWTECVENYCNSFAAELKSEMLSRVKKPRDISFMPWCRIFSESCARCERLCSIIRHQAESVAELTFPTQKDKEEWIESLPSKLWGRAQVHARIDTHVRFMVRIGRLCQDFGINNYDETYKMMNECLQKQVRLNACYNYYDRALKIAQRRIPYNVFVSWREQSEKETKDGDCIICMQTLKNDCNAATASDDNACAVICLPCKHRYHERCLTGWLQDHSSCPTCRFDLSSSLSSS